MGKGHCCYEFDIFCSGWVLTVPLLCPSLPRLQAQPVDVDMSKLPDHVEKHQWQEAPTQTSRGIDELRDSSLPREQWLPKNMEKKLSKRGEEMHESFVKMFNNEPNRD